MLIGIIISRNLAFFQAQIGLECYFSRSLLLKCQQLFMSRKNFMLSWVKHGKFFITSVSVSCVIADALTRIDTKIIN